MTTPAGDRAGLAPLPPVAPGDVPAGSADLWGGDGEVSAAHQEREQRLAGDEAQLRMPVAEQPHGRAIQA
jgi:hypothetical protein